MQTARLDATFAALADPTRRAIVARLAKGEASVMELAEPFEMSQPAISKHLRVLERAGLISRSRDAQRRPCRLEAAPLREATDWLQRYERTLITQNPEYVRMQVRYDYVYDLELTVKDDRFEIKVTGSERARGTPNGQRNATNLADGLLKRMEIKKRKRSEYKDRWTRSN